MADTITSMKCEHQWQGRVCVNCGDYLYTPTPVPAASERMTADDICYTCGDPRATHNNRTDTCTGEGCRCSSFVDRPQPDRAKADEDDDALVGDLREAAELCETKKGHDFMLKVAATVRTLSARVEAAEARATAVQPERKPKVSHVGAPACFALEQACKTLMDAFGEFGPYLVGSALERADWRDIDVRYILSDKAFETLFPDANLDNACWEFDNRWIWLCASISERLSKLTGLPVDFQFQPQTFANARHKKPRHPLGRKFLKAHPDGGGDA